MTDPQIARQLDHPSHAARLRAANWKSWSGIGPVPVSPFAEVAVMQRDGWVAVGRAGAMTWTWDAAPDGADPEDIVAYRVRAHSSAGASRA